MSLRSGLPLPAIQDLPSWSLGGFAACRAVRNSSSVHSVLLRHLGGAYEFVRPVMDFGLEPGALSDPAPGALQEFDIGVENLVVQQVEQQVHVVDARRDLRAPHPGFVEPLESVETRYGASPGQDEEAGPGCRSRMPCRHTCAFTRQFHFRRSAANPVGGESVGV